jgi:hypothetical protein
MPKVLVTLSQEALDILDRETGKRGRSSYLDGLVLDTLGKRKAKVETRAPDPLDALEPPVSHVTEFSGPEPAEGRLAVGTVKLIRRPDPKSAAPMVVGKRRLVRYEGDQAIWEDVKL